MSKYELKDLVQSFPTFLEYAWDELMLPEPTEAQTELAKYIDNNDKRKIIQCFRNMGKSWITSIYVTWRLLRDNNLKIMVVSANRDRATEFSAFTQKIVRDFEVLSHLTPRPDQRNSMLAFDVNGCKAAHAPSVKSVGITGQMTGSRANLIIFDDVEVPKNVSTSELREQLWNLTSEGTDVLSDGGEIMYLGTPHTTDGTIYDRLVLERNYSKMIIPFEYPSKEKISIYGGHLAPYIVKRLKESPSLAGSPVDIERFSSDDLDLKKLEKGLSGYELQYQLNPSLTDELKYPLKLKDLVVYGCGADKAPSYLTHSKEDRYIISNAKHYGFPTDRIYSPGHTSEEWSDYQGIVMGVDTAGRGKDKTAYSVVAHLNGKLFLLASSSLPGGYDSASLHILANAAKRYKVNTVVVESNFGDSMFNELLSPILRKTHNCALEEVRATTQKETRIIDTLEPLMNQHRLVVDRTVLEEDYENNKGKREYSLFYQMTHLTANRGSLKHDDSLDSLQIGIQYFLDQMALDEKEQYENQIAEAFEDTLQLWSDETLDCTFGIGGERQTTMSWI